MTTYKNRNDVVITATKIWERDHARETHISCSTHTGTHVDAPAHFCKHGSTIDALLLSNLCGPCVVLDLTDCSGSITRHDLKKHPVISKSRVLLKTKNSFLSATAPFDPSFVFLASDAADYLVEHQVSCVGIDYLGIERGQPAHDTHVALLKHDIPIIEGLRLGHVEAGDYMLTCLPLLIDGADAAPARAVLTALIP